MRSSFFMQVLFSSELKKALVSGEIFVLSASFIFIRAKESSSFKWDLRSFCNFFFHQSYRSTRFRWHLHSFSKAFFIRAKGSTRLGWNLHSFWKIFCIRAKNAEHCLMFLYRAEMINQLLLLSYCMRTSIMVTLLLLLFLLLSHKRSIHLFE